MTAVDRPDNGQPPATTQLHGTTNNSTNGGNAMDSLTAYVVVITEDDAITEIWAEDASGRPLSREDAENIADLSNAEPDNDRHHQAVKVTARRAPSGAR